MVSWRSPSSWLSDVTFSEKPSLDWSAPYPDASCPAHPALFVPYPLSPPDLVRNCLFLYCQYPTKVCFSKVGILLVSGMSALQHYGQHQHPPPPRPSRHSYLFIIYKLNQIPYMREEPVGRMPPLEQQVDPLPNPAWPRAKAAGQP